MQSGPYCYILKDEYFWPEYVTEAEVSDDETVLELGFLLILEIVQKGETFTQWSTYQHFNLLWKSFHRTFHDLLQEAVALLIIDFSVRKILLVSLSSLL